MGISVSPYLSILPEVKLSCKRCVWAFGVLLGSLWVWVWVGVKKLFVKIFPASWTFRVSVWTFHGGTVRQFFNCQSSMAVVTSQCLIVTENVYSKSRSMLAIQMIGQPVLPNGGHFERELTIFNSCNHMPNIPTVWFDQKYSTLWTFWEEKMHRI